MVSRIFSIMVAVTAAIAAPTDTGESIGDLEELNNGRDLPNGDVDLIETVSLLQRRRRSGNTGGTPAGWDTNQQPWTMGMDGGGVDGGGWGGRGVPGRDRVGGTGSGTLLSGELGPVGGRVDGRLTPGVAEGGPDGRVSGKGSGRGKGGSPKGSVKEIVFPEEAEGNGGRGRPGNRPKMTPYERWLQSQLLNQQLRPPPQLPEQGLVPSSYPRPPPPPPDYQQLKSRQFRPRLQKLDAYFGRLGVMSEDCRQRLLCEVSREPTRFFPLSNVLEEEAGFTGNYQYLTSQLVNSTEGARLLSYMEANLRGQDRARTCDIFQRRCLSRTEDMINFQSLIVWREMIRWLTIHVLTKAP